MSLQWYPGHMTSARRMMQENIKLIDIVIEILDARIPYSSRNPDIDDLAKNKFRLIILNKSDMADKAVTDLWIKYYKEKDIACVALDARKTSSAGKIMNLVSDVCKEKIERDRKKGILNRPIKAMIVGIPNSGKSTFINSFAGKACAKTGNKPGVTTGKQWIRINKDVELLDTPGILWPKFEDPKTGLHIAFIGSINDDILFPEDMAYELIQILIKDYPQVLNERYGIEIGDGSVSAIEILEMIGKKRGCLKKGAEIDLLKTSKILIEDFRTQKLGKITLEMP